MSESEHTPRRKRIIEWAWIAGVFLSIAAGLVFLESGKTDCGRFRPQSEVVALQAALESYKADFGGFPTGSSLESCMALTGNNPEGKKYIEFRLGSVSPQGAFLDPWGTPYRFYDGGGWMADPFGREIQEVR